MIGKFKGERFVYIFLDKVHKGLRRYFYSIMGCIRETGFILPLKKSFFNSTFSYKPLWGLTKKQFSIRYY